MVKCFVCTSPFKNKTTFTLVPLGRRSGASEGVWFCAAHTSEGETLQHLSVAAARAQLAEKREAAIRPHILAVTRPSGPSSYPRLGD